MGLPLHGLPHHHLCCARSSPPHAIHGRSSQASEARLLCTGTRFGVWRCRGPCPLQRLRQSTAASCSGTHGTPTARQGLGSSPRGSSSSSSGTALLPVGNGLWKSNRISQSVPEYSNGTGAGTGLDRRGPLSVQRGGHSNRAERPELHKRKKCVETNAHECTRARSRRRASLQATS